MNRRILQQFGVSEKAVYISALFRLYAQDIQNGIRDNGLIAIVGNFGVGKTMLFSHAVRAMRSNPDKAPVFVHVQNKNREKLTIGHVSSAVVYDISSEEPRRDMEARSRQVIRLVGELHVKHKHHICIVIENAHRLHANTLMAIKDMREDTFLGVSPLFSVVLIGQDRLAAKLAERKEVFWRSQIVELSESNGWMTYHERIHYLETVFGQAITQKARERIAGLYRVPLQMDWFVERKMIEVYQAGITKITEDCFEISPQEMLAALNEGLSQRHRDYISLSKVAEEAGVGKATVSDVLNGMKVNKKQAVQKAIERLAEKKREDSEWEHIQTRVA